MRGVENDRSEPGSVVVGHWIDRRTAQRRTRFGVLRTVRGPDRRVSGIADRRKEFQADMAEFYQRRSEDHCTPTCVHSQDAQRIPPQVASQR